MLPIYVYVVFTNNPGHSIEASLYSVELHCTVYMKHAKYMYWQIASSSSFLGQIVQFSTKRYSMKQCVEHVMD